MDNESEKAMRLDWISDSGMDMRLLPGAMRRRDNARRRRFMKRAIAWGLLQLREEQQEQLRLYYAGAMSRAGIARKQGVSDSWMSKSIRDGEEKLKSFAALYMEIYDKLEKELLSDD